VEERAAVARDVSKAKSHLLSKSSCILESINLAASMATLSGLNGDSPAAMPSAFTNSLQLNISGRMVKLAVVLPAPLHPATYKD
jgi:hypothetical protein